MVRTHRKILAGATALVAAAGVTACSSSSSKSSGGAKLTKVTLQLQWVTQGQFAGYIAAFAKGFYKQQGLDVTIKPAGTDTVPQTTVDDNGTADYAIAWVPKALQSREKGADITDVGQVFQRSGTLQISFKK